MSIFPYQGAQSRIRREPSYGVAGSGNWVQLNGFGVRINPVVELDPFAPPGAMVPTTFLVNDDFAEAEVEGRLDYNALAFVLAGLFGSPTITALGGAPAAYQWDWLWKGRRPNRPVSYEVDYGWPGLGEHCAGFVFNSLEISGGRADGFDVSGDGFAKAVSGISVLGGITVERQTVTITGTPAGGTFTLTLNGETTATIAYNANAAAVQTALEGLPSLEPGDVTVAGGPGPGTPYTVDFTGTLAGENVAQMTAAHAFTGGTSPNIAVATTTPGADAAVQIPAVPAGAVDGNAYLDTTWAGLGGTQLLYLYENTIQIGERMTRTRPINKSKSSDGTIDVGDQEHMMNLAFGRNAVEAAQLARLRAGTPVFARAEWEGATISGANKYRLRFDASLVYQSVGSTDDTDEVATREYEGRMAIDPVSGNVVAVSLINAISTLSP